MVSLLSSFTLTEVIIILIVAIPALWKGLKALINFFANLKKTKEVLIQEGKQELLEEIQTIQRFEKGEAEIQQLQKDEKKLTERVDLIEKQMKLLVQSDMLQIKRMIKDEHDKAMQNKFIDSEMLDLLEQQFKVYELEGGNGWAVKMMKEMRKLPTVRLIHEVGEHRE